MVLGGKTYLNGNGCVILAKLICRTTLIPVLVFLELLLLDLVNIM